MRASSLYITGMDVSSRTSTAAILYDDDERDKIAPGTCTCTEAHQYRTPWEYLVLQYKCQVFVNLT
jgi:hypothetical protein